MPRLVYPTIDIQGRRSPGGVEVYGDTDLPDGTILRYGVRAPGLFGALRGGQKGEVRVSSGRFTVAFEPSPWKSGSLAVMMSVLANRDQPPATQALLGDHGQRMAADVAGHNHAEYFVTKTVDLSRRTS